MKLRPRRTASRLAAGAAALGCLFLGTAPRALAARSAGTSPVNGSGSTYVGLAMQQWTADAQTLGLTVNYTPTGSPDGLNRFATNGADFAGTEAEFASLGTNPNLSRGYQYVPDVAGAVAVMYNVDDKAGRKVDYLHLSRRTVARIFTGGISRWSDPAITADNAGISFPDKPINVVYRSSPSGTTALFYDFVKGVAPDVFGPWAAANGLPTDIRIIDLSVAPHFTPLNQGIDGSDQMAQFVASSSGKWSIAYDEFGYARTYGTQTAWVQNAGGKWVLPYAENISAALEGARLRPDLSQELSGVYNSLNPLAYPISAYSYLVTQCSAAGDRPTCKGNYTDLGKANTLARWMRYIACDGQVAMASIGYSPLPPNLSQEIANSVGRMMGTKPEALTAGNCSNPRFHGSLGAGASSPSDPMAGRLPASGSSGPGGTPGATGVTRGAGGAPGATGTGSQHASTDGSPKAADKGASKGALTPAAAGRPGGAASLGGSSTWRDATPVEYRRGTSKNDDGTVVAIFLLLLLVPAAVASVWSVRRRTAGAGAAPG